MAETLFVKKTDKGLKVSVKDITGNSKHSEESYNTTIQLSNYKALADFLDDLRILFGAPIEKAFYEMQKKKSPLW